VSSLTMGLTDPGAHPEPPPALSRAPCSLALAASKRSAVAASKRRAAVAGCRYVGPVTSDIEQLALELRDRIADANVTVAPVTPTQARKPDVSFIDPDVTADDLIELLRTVRPAFVFVAAETFDPDDLDTDDEEVGAAVQERAGDAFQMSVLWAADGLLYEWRATADWYEALRHEAAIVNAGEHTVGQVEWELRRESSAAAAHKLMDFVMASPGFRRARPRQRTTQIQLVLDEHPDLAADLLYPEDFKRAARQQADGEVAKWEQRLEDDEELITELTKALHGTRTVAQRKQVAADVIREFTDWWTLTDEFVDRLIREALLRR